MSFRNVYKFSIDFIFIMSLKELKSKKKISPIDDTEYKKAHISIEHSRIGDACLVSRVNILEHEGLYDRNDSSNKEFNTPEESVAHVIADATYGGTSEFLDFYKVLIQDKMQSVVNYTKKVVMNSLAERVDSLLHIRIHNDASVVIEDIVDKLEDAKRYLDEMWSKYKFKTNNDGIRHSEHVGRGGFDYADKLMYLDLKLNSRVFFEVANDYRKQAIKDKKESPMLSEKGMVLADKFNAVAVALQKAAYQLSVEDRGSRTGFDGYELDYKRHKSEKKYTLTAVPTKKQL